MAIICLAASGLLSVVHNLTQPKILAQAREEEEASLKEVFPAADHFTPARKDEEVLYYQAQDKQGRLLGYAFKATRRGYSSEIVTMVGMDTQGIITRIKVLAQNETPGLGSRITEVIQKETLWDVLLKKVKLAAKPQAWFQAQFSGKKYLTLDHSVNAITGATISSRAVIDSVRDKAVEIMEMVK